LRVTCGAAADAATVAAAGAGGCSDRRMTVKLSSVSYINTGLPGVVAAEGTNGLSSSLSLSSILLLLAGTMNSLIVCCPGDKGFLNGVGIRSSTMSTGRIIFVLSARLSPFAHCCELQCYG